MKRLTILGSTGSIGKSTLKVVRKYPTEFPIFALSGGKNIQDLKQQIEEFSPKIAVIQDRQAADELAKKFPKTKILSGQEGLFEISVSKEADTVVSAISGMAGLAPTLKAVQAGKTIALANKESIVAGGEFFMHQVEKYGATLLPVDSEHSALFQALQGGRKSEVQRLILTASGGPFLHYSKDELETITLEQALKHPNWDMGPKITIDSSTLMNKALEVIEAVFLFNIPKENVSVAIHPQSIIHSMVEFCDGSILAQMSEPDMVLPIQYALTYPKRLPGILTPFDFGKVRELNFYPPDYEKFPCLGLAFLALEKGGSAPCYFNAAKEALVQIFIEGKIPWKKIGEGLTDLLKSYHPQKITSLDTIVEIECLAHQDVENLVNSPLLV